MPRGSTFVSNALVSGTAALTPHLLAKGSSKVSFSKPKFNYIDIHTHLGRFYYGKEVTIDGLINWMDQHFIERAVILPLVSPEATTYLQTSEAALAAYRAHPQRIVPFCCVDPRGMATAWVENSRRGHIGGLEGMISVLRRFQEEGARGLGEHKVGLPFDHPLMMTLYEACQSLYLPILFHLDDIRGIDGPGLPRLGRALEAFPELPFIGHCAGFWSSITGDATIEDFRGYPERRVTPGGALDLLMDRYPNLYGDLSAPSGENAITRDPDFGRQFLVRRADRLLFGTDYLQSGQKVPQFELLASMDLPEEIQYKIYRGNAIRLLKLNIE